MSAEDTLHDCIHEALANLDSAEATLSALAATLVEEFWIKKKALEQRQAEWLRTTQQPGPRKRAGGQTYAPLYLRMRVRGSGLELGWRLARISRSGKAFYRDVRKGTSRPGAGYHMGSLLAHAREWERGLIQEMEGHANQIRLRWSRLQASKRSLRNLEKMFGEVRHPATDATPQQQPVHPRIAPEPPGWSDHLAPS